MTNVQRRLMSRARRARNQALAPYSRFPVGAALETVRGRIYTGCNVESSTYGLSICAERVALFKAVSEGERRFGRLAVAAAAERLVTPCGACRQVLWDVCGDIELLLMGPKGKCTTRRLQSLFPDPFDTSTLSVQQG